MNHKINVNDSNNDKKEINTSQSIILEKELKEIYNTQYYDLFPKILTKSKSEFISLLKSQVSLHLKIINKTSLNSLNEKYIEIFTNKFFIDKKRTTKGFEDLIKNNDLQKNYLQLVNCFIHCHKCSSILHQCKNKMILYKGYIFCIHCQKVYNENQIKLYCEECKTCYYSKLRYLINKKFENFYNVCFKEYHCKLEEQEKIKCLECGHDLYYNITYDKKNAQKNSISEIFCLKCKLLFDMNEIFFKCKKCKNNFKSEAIIHSNFSILKIKFLLIMHTLRKKKMALPEKRTNRKCKCDISKYEKYLHEEDNGVLYLGHNLKGEYIILCDCCYSIFDYNDFIWTCPICNINFKSKKNLHKKNYVKTMNYFGDKISSRIEKSPTMYKSPSNVNIIHQKKLIESIPTSSSGKVKNNNLIKNLFNENKINQSEQNTKRNSHKFNHTTKVIMLTTNKKSKNININNLNFSEQKLQKVHLFKKIKNSNTKNNNNYYTSVNEATKENDIRKTNLKSFIKNKNYTNSNTINSILNSISFTNNKSESNTNKCNDSTNITTKNCEGVNEANNKDKIIISNIKQEPSNRNNINNIIKRKLIYNYLSEQNKNAENKITKEKIENNKNQIKDEKSCEIVKKEKDSITRVIIRKERKNHKKLEIKKVNVSLNNKLNKEKEISDYFEDNNKNKNINEIKEKTKNIEDKIKNNKSMRNLRSNNNHLKIKNVKTSNYIKINNNPIRQNKQIPLTTQNSQSKIKLVKSLRNINDNIKIIKKIDSNNNENKSNIIIEKKYITRCPTQFKIQNKKNKSSYQKINSIFKRIKDYYEEGIKDEKSVSKERKKVNNINKSVTLTEEKKMKYRAFFKSENFSILKLLGKGTYAKTYLVEDPKTKERFALKKITINDKIELKENQEEYNLILKLTKEFPDLKIINIYGIEIKNLDKYTTVMYVLMEAAKYDWEKEIKNHLVQGSYYKEEQLMNILYNLVKSFAILQRKGISHRDVKPQNILCFSNGEYKISDFGEAKNFKKNIINNQKLNNNKFNLEDNTMEQTLRGTELYMSPILFQALRARSYQYVTYNPYKSDVFSLGMCFFLASSLSYEGLYEIREIFKNGSKTKLVANRYLSLKYSQKYINLLISMLQINEKDRPDFIELEKNIDDIYN